MSFDSDDIYKLIALFFSVLIILNGYFVARLAKTWFVPGAIISIFWFGYTFFPLLCLYSVPVNTLSIIYIFIAIFTFVLPSCFFNWSAAFAANRLKVTSGMRFEFHTRFLIYTFYLMQILVIVTIISDILAQGFSLKNVLFNLMETSSQYIALRYSEEVNISILSRMGTVFTYVGVMLGGLVFSATPKVKAKYLILFLSLLPSIIVMVVQGVKGTLFLCAIFFYSTFLIYRLCSGNLFLTDKKTNKNLLITLMLVFPAIVSSFLSRGLYDYDYDYVMGRLISYFSSYAFAHVYAFSDWFSFYIGSPHVMHYETYNDYFYGFYTFMSIFKFLGSSITVPPGVYDEYFQYNDLITTNIYTFFRGLILDFGILGSLCFMLILGTITSFSFYILLRSLRPYFSISFFATMAGFYYSSFIISVFIWNSIFFTFVIFAFILYLNRKLYIYKFRAKQLSSGIK